MSLIFLISVGTIAPQSVHAANLLTFAEKYFSDPGARRVGIEVEFTGLTIDQVMKKAQRILGGAITEDIEEYKKTGLKKFVLQNSSIGDLVIKVETNQTDDAITPPHEWF